MKKFSLFSSGYEEWKRAGRDRERGSGIFMAWEPRVSEISLLYNTQLSLSLSLSDIRDPTWAKLPRYML